MKSREFRYRPHIKWTQYAFVAIMGLGSILPNLIVAVTTGLDGGMYLPAAISAMFFGVLTLVLFWVFRSMASTRVVVDEQGVRYSTYRKDYRVSFDEISSLKFPAIPYLGGWLKIKSHQPDIRLTVVLEDLDELVRLLKEGLDDADNAEAYQQKKMYRFYRTAGFATQSWDRCYRYFLPIIGATAVILLFWIVGAAVFFDEITLAGAFLAGSSITLPAMGWAIGEFFLLVAYLSGCERDKFGFPTPTREKERRLIGAGFGVYFALVVLGASALLFVC